MNLQVSTITKLQAIEALYRRGYSSEFIDRTIDKILSMVRDNAQQEMTELRARLDELEFRYKMASEDFFNKFQAGELGDSADFFEWSASYDMWLSLMERLEKLEVEQA